MSVVVPKGYKQTKVGVIPKDWECEPARHYFTKRIAKGYEGLEIYSVTINKSWQKRSDLARHTGSDVDVEKSLLAEKGDLVYNTMRMWQGALGMAENSGVVSPAYIVIRPKPTVDSKYAFYLLKSYTYLHYLQAYSYGLTSDRLRLYFQDFGMIPFVCPPLKEQQKIAEILSAWDNAVMKLEALIAKKEKYKKGLMQKLLSAEVRFEGFSGKWKIKEVHELFTLIKDKVNPKEQETRCIELEHIEQNSGQITGYVNSSNQQSMKAVFEKGDILFGKLRPYLRKYWLASFNGICSTEILVLRPKKDFRTDFLFYLVHTDSFIAQANITSGTKMPRADWSYMQSIPIKMPMREDEQQKIAEVLTLADNEIKASKKEFQALKKQKKGLMQQLLTGKVRVKV